MASSLKKIKEGSAEILVPVADKISKQMDVFYNPVMKINRDMSVLLLKQFPPMAFCDLMAGTGVRAIRFAKELKYKTIAANDYSKKAFQLIKKNMRINNIESSLDKNNKTRINREIKIFNEDADIFLLNSRGFDYIDIDPFGTSNFFLDSATKRISRNGILAVTNTDTSALTGTYPEACARKYWAVPKRDYMMHETGLRILIRKIQLIGMQYEKALIPIFSYFKDHYFRIYFKSVKGKKECHNISKQHGVFNDAGPLWTGNLFDSKLANKMHLQLLKDKLNNRKSRNNKNNQNNDYNKELSNFLKIIKEESKIDSIGFYDIHHISKEKKLKTMIKKEDLIRKIREKGHKASETHFSGTGIRSDISYKGLIEAIKQ